MKKGFGVLYIIIGALIFLAQTASTISTLPNLSELEGEGTVGFIVFFVVISLALYALSVWLIRKGWKRLKEE